MRDGPGLSNRTGWNNCEFAFGIFHSVFDLFTCVSRNVANLLPLRYGEAEHEPGSRTCTPLCSWYCYKLTTVNRRVVVMPPGILVVELS